MSSPNPFLQDESNETLRRRWLQRYVLIQSKTDKEIKTVLTEGAEDANERILALAEKSTFSNGVRTAQIRLAIKETSVVLNDIFKQSIPIIKRGQGNEAIGAVEGLSDTDRNYLLAIFGGKRGTDAFLAAQRNSARLGVAHAISTTTKSNIPLSTRVYRTRALSSNWVKRLVTNSILRGDSAKDLAKAVRSNIRPDTPGGVSFAAMRLARTELNSAFHATTIVLSQDRPWIENMKWNLSASHTWEGTREKPVEICERYAAQIFTPDTVPAKPHPQCYCYATPTVEDFQSFTNHLLAGHYDNWRKENETAA